MTDVNIELHVSIEDSRWQTALEQPIEDFLKTYIAATLNYKDILPNIPRSVEVSILLTNDAEIKDLNREYRGKDKPTNVLSFPQEEDVVGMKNLDACVLLGDIVLSIEMIQLEAQQQQKLMSHHLAHLTVHSTLHLIGCDHENDSDAEEMESLEIQILEMHNISNPYESDPSYMV